MLKRIARTLLLGGCLALTGALGTRPAIAGEGQRQGQGQGKPGFSVDEKLQHMTQQLSLTPDQQAKMRTLLEKQKAAMDSGEKKPGMWDDFKAQIHVILNDEQDAKFDTMQAQAAERWKQQHPQQQQKPYDQQQKPHDQQQKPDQQK